MCKRYSLILIMFGITALSACATTEKQQRTEYGSAVARDMTIKRAPGAEEGGVSTGIGPVGDTIRVATLNIAHGRKDSFNQLFVFGDTFQKNLDDIVEVLKLQQPDIVALQEADDVSSWSGSFNHVGYIASHAGYPWRTQVSNAESWMFSYGTAILSVLPILETVKHTFASSPPTTNKGFVLAQIDLPYGNEGKYRKLDLISVHLDFSRSSVRDAQILEIKELLTARMNPTIIMGDFNSDWFASESVINAFVNESRFVTYKPEDAERYNTYKDHRLDWILVSKDLEFVSYTVLSDVLSDHRMIVADIRFKQSVKNYAGMKKQQCTQHSKND